MNATIRAMTDADLDAVADLELAVFPDPWSDAMLASELHAPGAHCVVAVDGDAVVGYAMLRADVPDEAWIHNLAVTASHQRHGLGTKLLQALLAAAADRDAVWLEVRTGNDAALALYRRHGFAPVGMRPRYYPDGSDAYVMARRR